MYKIISFMMFILLCCITACTQDTKNMINDNLTEEIIIEEDITNDIIINEEFDEEPVLTGIELDGSTERLVIKPVPYPPEFGDRDCGKLGRLSAEYTQTISPNDNADNEEDSTTSCPRSPDPYQPIQTQGITEACFDNVAIWKPGMIYGQYHKKYENPEETIGTSPKWFITDINGNVHHLKTEPSIGRRYFKNAKIIREYRGNPVYINGYNKLVSFNMENNTEKNLTPFQTLVYTIINKPSDKQQIFYINGSNEGRRLTPDDLIKEVPEIVGEKFFYQNMSGDLSYKRDSISFYNMIFDNQGNIINRQASAVPVAYQEWIDNGEYWVPVPKAPAPAAGSSNCARNKNILFCDPYYSRPYEGFIIADSSQDFKKINFTDFVRGASWVNGLMWGAEIKAGCLNNDKLIYIYSETIYQSPLLQTITRINIDLNSFEHILTDTEIGMTVENLTCHGHGGILAEGYDSVTYEEKRFRWNNGIRITDEEEIDKYIFIQ